MGAVPLGQCVDGEEEGAHGRGTGGGLLVVSSQSPAWSGGREQFRDEYMHLQEELGPCG